MLAAKKLFFIDFNKFLTNIVIIFIVTFVIFISIGNVKGTPATSRDPEKPENEKLVSSRIKYKQTIKRPRNIHAEKYNNYPILN